MSPMTRRGLLAASAALPLAACATPPGVPPLSAAPPAPWTPDATAVAAMIRRGDITAVEAVEAAIRRAEALQPQLNFLTTRAFDQAMDRARRGGLTGPFAGVPTLVKDLDDLRGFPTRNGARYAMAAPPATGQDPYVDALERAGFIFIGKSATPEHGFLPTTEPLAFGPTRNPWDPSRSSGGSSGGAAAAVAAGVVPLAHATDGGGSIRIPASCCGLFGLKPSRGRLIQEASDLPIILGVGHVVSHSVRDSAAMFAAGERLGSGAAYPPVGMVSAPVGRRIRVGLVMESGVGRTPSDEVQAAVRSTAALLADLGHTVEPTVWPIEGTRFAQDFTTLWAAGAAQLVAEVGKAAGRTPDETLLEPFTLEMARQIRNAPKGAVDAAIGRLKADALAYDGWFARFDVILSPVLGHAPPLLGEFRGDVNYEDLQERLVNYVGYTPLHNVAGAPAMSVPLYWTQGGLPVGSQIAARAGNDGLLLELAYELEQARPWAHLRPPVYAL